MPNSKVSKFDRKLESGGNKGNRGIKKHLQTVNSSVEFNETILNSVNSSTNCSTISSGKSNDKKTSNSTSENKIIDKIKSNVGRFGSVRNANCSINIIPDDQLTKSKSYCTKKFTNELGSKLKNYQSDYNKDNSINRQDYKSRTVANLAPRFSNQITSTFQHESNQVVMTQYSRDETNTNINSVYAVARQALDEQFSKVEQSYLPKMAPINFPPLRAPQSIVNVRHPFVTESRTKHNDISVSNGLKPKSTLNTIMQSTVKELEPGRQTYPNFGTSTLNIATSISPFPRPDSFSQPTLASVLFPDTGQFSQSASSYSTNQLNQFQTFDPGNYHTATPVIPQFSDSSLSFPQYDNTTFVQPNHYPTADLSNNQFQYQTTAVRQIQDSPLFIQSLQNPITMSDQYATPNYARAVRTELVQRLRRPPRFSK